jgi:TolB protein
MKKLLVMLFALVILPLHAGHAAPLKVSVTKASLEALPIAIPNFYVQPGADAQLATGIPQVITNNLKGSGLFAPISPGSFVQDPAGINAGVNFGGWRSINAKNLVSGTVTRSSDGRTRVEFRLWDVYGEKQMIGMAYTTTPENWRRIAHIISDEIYKRVTGEQAYFDSRIVYIAESGPATKRIKRLAIMDQDGFNNRYLTDGSSLVLTPRFSPNDQTITYMAYYNNKPRVYLYNIDTGRQQVMGDFPGMTFSPRFSPDGSKIVMSVMKGGNSDIFTMDLRSRSTTQLTNTSGIDTSPSYSPDASKIVFESDRGGTQQIYVMGASGGDAKRISYGSGRYATPVWSPRGDLIAFTRLYQGQFCVGVMKPDGSGERLLTCAYHVEGPTWSPNGRVISFFKDMPSGDGRRARVSTIDITGYNERELNTPGDGSDPAWSPLNP